MYRLTKFMLVACGLCLILSFGLAMYTLVALSEVLEEQREFEKNVATMLDTYADVLGILADRQTRTETIVMEGQQLRLTLNEIEEYNKKQRPGNRRQKYSPRNLSIGGP